MKSTLMKMAPPRRPGARRQRGTAAVELGMVLPLLVLLMMGTIEFGRAFYTYNTLVKAARSAARHLSLADAENATVQQQARNLLRFGDVESGGALLVPGLQESMIDICTPDSSVRACRTNNRNVSTGSGNVNLVTVSVIGYRYTYLFMPGTPALAFNTISMTVRKEP